MEVTLKPDLEQFARDCVADGRYEDVGAVIKAALALLQEQEERRKQLSDSLDEAMAEADRDGCFTAAEVAAEMRAAIETAAREAVK
ncbi:type II toxin-antitoxin system ParD family antitoxin [Caulobacter sp. D4A]|uniref:type II toxin-antitoxin system ParD family antitoxin n=1 Tax=unclassified Caulobacter TaxID=2648921 RepID=UPI000D72D63D|nr:MULTISPECIES: type II toxin-antitoxin system ParD family antitoxin [unclassified Caulobacter]PXA90289.1 type II toxin-antitoxin system ParD family antitoxin [Caulobacter sp. D4A]PXA96401.1 type II toxin-antitoxin system ParD family antitoxin [Caulobacter sp. D5]